MEVEVCYKDVMNIGDVATEISHKANPNILLWYIGVYGLKQQSVDFYKTLISNVYSNNSASKFWLYDLTAWGALKHSNLSVNKQSSHIAKINQIDNERIKCIAASEVFSQMQSMTDGELIDYFQHALSREFVWRSSMDAKMSNISLRNVFKDGCLLLSRYYDCDSARAYSMLQYLEGCLLVENIVAHSLNFSDNQDINIYFALPNDELKYYIDANNSFKQDIEFLLGYLYKDRLLNTKISIVFFAIQYGNAVHHRPYHGTKQTVRLQELERLHMTCKLLDHE